MRICIISREYPPDTGWGGIGAYAFQHARALKEQGHDVEVVALTKKEMSEDSSVLSNPDDPLFVPVHRAAWGPLLQELTTVWISLPYTHFALKGAFALWRKFIELHSRAPFDVVEAPEHLAEALFPSLTRICPLLLRLHTPHSKFIAERYHNLNTSFDQQLLAVVERVPMLEADVLSSPSQDLAEYVASDTAVDLASIEIVYNPVDCKKFAPEGEKAIAGDGRVTVFFAGRLEERKGIQYLIEAVPLIMKHCRKVRFLVVGADTMTGPGGTSVLSALKRKLAEHGADAEKAVEFISHVPLDKMPAHYRCADICVVPSLYENGPYTVLEAQASGKPVVGTTAGGSKEYIADGQTGFVVPARNAQALADAITKLVADEALRLRMGDAARKLSLEKFDRTVIVKQALASYELAISRHKTRAAEALYRRDPEQSLSDFISLLYGYHKNLCDLLYRHSWRYKASYWLQLALRRPRLFGAKLVLTSLKRINATFSFAPRKIEETVRNIEAQVQERETERERLLLQELMAACQLGINSKAGLPK